MVKNVTFFRTEGAVADLLLAVATLAAKAV